MLKEGMRKTDKEGCKRELYEMSECNLCGKLRELEVKDKSGWP